MHPEAARDFRLQLKAAREYALKDAEAFDGIIHVVERLGSFRLKRVESLGKYRPVLEVLANSSPLATDIPAQWRDVHTPFRVLYNMVMIARNDALHIGASARHLTTHAIELALILEDALMTCEDGKYVSDYMVRDPVCAHRWQPVSFVRQRLLTNSFSYLPMQDAAGKWCLVSDLQVAKYLQGHGTNERKRRLARPIGDVTEISPMPANPVGDQSPIGLALEKFDGTPILVFREKDEGELVGILTAFDLL